MKILVLMPCDERQLYACYKIYQGLNEKAKDKVFFTPMFIDYLLQTKIHSKWIEAFYDTLCRVKQVYNQNKDFILFGNIDKNYKFDAIFSFQDLERTLPYQDGTIEKIKEIDFIKNDPQLLAPLNALYSADDVNQIPLTNCSATAELINKFFESDPQLDKIKAEYQLSAASGGSNERNKTIS